MFKIKNFMIKIGLFSALFCCSSIATADTNLDYNSMDLGALQNQYQHQLKPKSAKKVLIKKPGKHKSKRILSNELLQYQRLLNNQQALQKQQIQRQPVRKPVSQGKKTIPTRLQQQAVPAPRAASKPLPRRDAIFEAASVGNVRLIGQLLSQGVNVNQANTERETALHMAAAKGHYSAVIYLLNHGANINSRTINNWLPIHHATRFRHAQIANYLKQRGSPIYAKTSDGLSAVDMARAMNDHRILGIFGVR